MNKKTLIQTIIIIVCFGAAGLVLYKGIFSHSSPPVGNVSSVIVTGTGVNSGAASVSIDKILPYGTTLDFDKVLNIRNFQYGLTQNPKLQFNQEVGVPVENLLSSPVGQP